MKPARRRSHLPLGDAGSDPAVTTKGNDMGTASAAITTLQNMGYTYQEGAELWKPPLGKRPDFERLDLALELIGVLSSAIHIFPKGPQNERARELFRKIYPPSPAPEGRCETCGWPLTLSWGEGCVPGNCCMREKQ